MTARSGARVRATSDRRLPKGRLEAFSDGVFAIAITLLVLELHVPPVNASLGTALLAEWPAYLGYLVSFAFIGGTWIAHSTTTRFIGAVDPVWMRLNLVLLLLVSLLPFTTSLMATHLNQTDARTVTVLFGVNLTLAAAVVSGLTRHSARTAGVAADGAAREDLLQFAAERRFAVWLQAASTALAVLVPVAAVVVFLVLSLLILLDPLVRVRRVSRAEGSADETDETDETDGLTEGPGDHAR